MLELKRQVRFPEEVDLESLKDSENYAMIKRPKTLPMQIMKAWGLGVLLGLGIVIVFSAFLFGGIAAGTFMTGTAAVVWKLLNYHPDGTELLD